MPHRRPSPACHFRRGLTGAPHIPHSLITSGEGIHDSAFDSTARPRVGPVSRLMPGVTCGCSVQQVLLISISPEDSGMDPSLAMLVKLQNSCHCRELFKCAFTHVAKTNRRASSPYSCTTRDSTACTH